MKAAQYILFVFLALILVYSVQGTLYGHGFMVSRVALALFLGISIAYLIKVNLLKRQPLFLKVRTLFLVLHIVSYIFIANFSGDLEIYTSCVFNWERETKGYIIL